MSLLNRTRIFRPSTFAVHARSLATTVDTPAAGPSSALAEEPAAVPTEPLPRPTAPTAVKRTRLEPLPQTPPPTPYHAFVHLPLLTLNGADARASSSSGDGAGGERLLVPLPSPLFNVPSRPSLLHKLVIAHLSSLRAGTAASKNRSEVAFSGRKIKPQKGTGGARLGSKGSPMLKGGGHAFGKRPKGPEGWLRRVNRKEERLGLCVSLSEKWRGGNLAVVDRLAMDQASTRQLESMLKHQGWLDALFIVGDGRGGLERDGHQVAFELSSGNLPNVSVTSDVDNMGVYDIIKRKKVVMELEAVDQVIRRLNPDVAHEMELDALAEEMEDMEFEAEQDEADEVLAGAEEEQQRVAAL